MRTFYVTFILFISTLSITIAQETSDVEEILETEQVVVEPSTIWESSYNTALERAQRENKPLLIYFTGSDWCGPCKVLKRTLFDTEEFKKYSEKIVLYKADFPRNKNLVDAATQKINKELSIRFGQRKYPTLLALNAKEQELGIKEGMYMPEYYYPFFDKVIKNK